MSRHGSLKYQLNQRINELKRFGESKHQAKQLKKAQCKSNGDSWNPAKVDGIFSFRTADAYRETGNKFITWEKEHYPNQKILKEIPKDHIKEYLLQRINEGKSAWTIKKDASALAKIYGCSSQDFGISLPQRHIEDRVKNLRTKEFSQKRNRDLVTLCKGTGLRRHEIKALKPENIFVRNDRLYVKVERGKGGKSRVVPVLREYEQAIKEITNRVQEQDKIIQKIPGRAPIHMYRREYAKNLYQEIIEGKNIEHNQNRNIIRTRDGRVYDREITRDVSRALGHNRVDVVISNYFS